MKNQIWSLSLCTAALLIGAACAQAAPVPTIAPLHATATLEPTATEVAPTATVSSTPAPFELTSPDFENGGVIPKEFGCTGNGFSPQLSWGEPPAGTQSFALIFNDPTLAPGWVHWVAFNLPASARGLQAHEPADTLAEGGVEGASSWGTPAYGGPCPPAGSTHTYIFSLYALDTLLDLTAAANRKDLLAAMDGHILAQADLSATFTR